MLGSQFMRIDCSNNSPASGWKVQGVLALCRVKVASVFSLPRGCCDLKEEIKGVQFDSFWLWLLG